MRSAERRLRGATCFLHCKRELLRALGYHSSTAFHTPFSIPGSRTPRYAFCKKLFRQAEAHQNRQTKRISMTRPSAPKGPYCFSSSSQLMRTAARLYLAESSRSLEDMSPVQAHVSYPLYHIHHFFVVLSSTYPSSRGSHLGRASPQCSLS